MPPEQVGSIPVPTTRGEDARQYLEASGLVARTAPIRSRDYRMCLSDPFRYYLCRRLGLAKRSWWSEALSRGSWFHKALERDRFPDRPELFHSRLEKDLNAKFDELRQVFINSPSAKVAALEREQKDFSTALGWYEAALTVPIGERGTLREVLSKPYWTYLDRELRLTYKDPAFPKVPLVAQFDALLYHKEHNKLWLLDPKTCAEPPSVRLASCPIEFQCEHYRYILEKSLPALRAKYNLPDDVTVGGMIHVAVQKPTIRFGSKDRKYRETSRTLSRGPRKGQVVTDKEYYGDPDLELYVDRCKHWYHGTGDYVDDRPAREADPPVNISWTHGPLLGPDLIEYIERLKLVYGFATQPARPWLFLRSERGVTSGHGELSPYAPFYLTPPRFWPEVVRQEQFMVTFPDEDLMEPAHAPQ